MRAPHGLLAALVLWSLTLAPQVCASVIFVNAAASGANDGTSWTDAYTSLQPALTTAASGDEIWVAAATYRPTATANRSLSFALKNGVGVYGGFAGTETLRSQRNVAANVTVLSGDIGTPGVATDNSYHVVTADASVTATGVLDGFTITAGQADGATPDDRGAGLLGSNASPTVAHCTFASNNASSRGGGARLDGGSAVFTDCVFTGNSAGLAGGGVSAGAVTSVTLTRCVIQGNSAGDGSRGGGLDVTNGVTLADSLVAQNSTNGIVYFQGGNAILDSTVTGHAGYGVSALSGASTIANSILWSDATGELFVNASASVSVSYSDVQGGGFAGPGNVNADPHFVNPAAGDWRLGTNSPAVDAGSNALVPASLTTDLSGLPRFFDDPAVPDTGAGTPPIVDMGAYERVPLSVTAPSPQTVCAGQRAGFAVAASGQGTLTYRWRRNAVNLSDGGPISGATTASLTINPSATGDQGFYDVVVTDGFGQNVTSPAAALTVLAVPPAPAAGNSGPVCAGQTLQLTASTITGATYVWTGPNGFASALQNPSIANATVGASGLYSVTATVNGCTSAAGTTTAAVNAVPDATLTAPASVCPSSTGNTASVPDAGPGATYAWVVTSGTITAGAGTRSITFTAGRAGPVQLSVTVTSNGCSANGSASVTVGGLCPQALYTLTPCRLIDTRGPAGTYGQPALSSSASRTFPIIGQCGVPADAIAVAVNVTIVQPTNGPGFLTFYPGGTARPLFSTINYKAGQIRANNAIVLLGAAGDFTVYCGQGGGTTHVVVDVSGYFR